MVEQMIIGACPQCSAVLINDLDMLSSYCFHGHRFYCQNPLDYEQVYQAHIEVTKEREAITLKERQSTANKKGVYWQQLCSYSREIVPAWSSKGKKIKAARNKRGVSQRELVDMIGQMINHQTLGAIEQGRALIVNDTLMEALSEVLEIDVGAIYA